MRRVSICVIEATRQVIAATGFNKIFFLPPRQGFISQESVAHEEDSFVSLKHWPFLQSNMQMSRISLFFNWGRRRRRRHEMMWWDSFVASPSFPIALTWLLSSGRLQSRLEIDLQSWIFPSFVWRSFTSHEDVFQFQSISITAAVATFLHAVVMLPNCYFSKGRPCCLTIRLETKSCRISCRKSMVKYDRT